MTDFIIEADGLTRRFGETLAVNGLQLHIARGEVFGFLGPNGAGKTTTVRLLNGVLSPSAGTMRVGGFDPVTQGSRVRQRSGVLTETPALYESLSARRNLLIFGALYGVAPDELPRRVDDALGLFGLQARGDEKAGGYSKGMKQRLALARALIHEPEVLFLDEPTAGLDPAAARQVTELIEQLSEEEGRTIFLCTHNLTEAQRLCDRVGVINQGSLVALGTPAELARELWHGNWVQIELAGPAESQVLAAVQALAGVSELQVNARLLDIHVDDLDRTPDVVHAICMVGGRITRVAPREHTLEEIYFQLQENGEAIA